MIDLDQAMLDRVLPAEPELAGWDDVLSRSRVHEGRRRRRLVVLAAITLLLVATACAFGVRALILDKGFIGLPPEGATPSTPESGELVLSYFGPEPRTEGTGPRMVASAITWLFLYADGRLITHRNADVAEGANPRSAGFIEQRLTAEGVELLRSEVVSSLFRPDHLSPESKPVPSFALEVRDGDRLVAVGSDTEPSEPLQVPVTFDFERFVARLTHPESWLPASAWVERTPRAYVPARYAVCGDPAQTLSTLPAKAQELLAKAQLLAPNRFGPPGPSREDCRSLTTAEARTVAEALEDGGLEHDPGQADYILQYFVEVPGTAQRGTVYFEPMLPNGDWICSPCG